MDDISAINLANSIKNLVKGDIRNDFIIGTVTCIEPLKIDIGNNIELSGNFLYLGQNVRPHKVTIPHKHLIDALLSESSKGIKTTNISSGTATNVEQKINYSTYKQRIDVDKDKGLIDREKVEERHDNVDIGGATLGMNINVTGSSVTGSSVSGGAVTANVVNTIDVSSFTVNDDGHKHLIEQHETLNVHFPDDKSKDYVMIDIYPKLKVGDKVLMFAFNRYQVFYVAERIEVSE